MVDIAIGLKGTLQLCYFQFQSSMKLFECWVLLSLAKPDPKREARGSGDKPIPTFVPQLCNSVV